jgi:rare lipoprotein A
MGRCSLGVIALAMLLFRGGSPLDAGGPRRTATQVGLASYYGRSFHGSKTASGEIFDQRDLVAAHRTLPLGSVVKVTNLENGRSVVLRVIDRGPFGRNRRKGCIIDVSRAAARQLRFVRDGFTRVRVDVMRLSRHGVSPQPFVR